MATPRSTSAFRFPIGAIAFLLLAATFLALAGGANAYAADERAATFRLEGGESLLNDPGALDADVLDGATVRMRPAGSTNALAVGENGALGGVVRLSHLDGSSRLLLEKADESHYRIRFYDSFTAKDPKASGECMLGIAGSDSGEGAPVRAVGDGEGAGASWRLIRQDDGTYHVANRRTGRYWSLERPDDLNADGNMLCEASQPMKWEMEVVSGGPGAKALDSYNLERGGTTVTSLDWMSSLPGDAYLTDLSIPGVHDAATCNVGEGSGAGDYQCQQFYIDDLLGIGVRYLDLRFYDQDGVLALRHGDDATGRKCLNREGEPIAIDELMGWVRGFLQAHPGETVIFQMKDETDKDTASACVRDYFLDLVRQGDPIIYVGDGAPRLKDVRGKIVLVSRMSPEKAGGSYYVDDEDRALGSWALYAKWQEGSDYASAKAAETSAYEFWTQDKYDLDSPDKWTWIERALFGADGAHGARYRLDNVASGKKAWVVNYTSCTKIPARTPLDCARDINGWLKEQKWLGTDRGEFTGIVCSDFTDEQLAQRVYAINYRLGEAEPEKDVRTFKVGKAVYEIIGGTSSAARLVSVKSVKSFTLPATVKANGVKLKVTGIAAKAFAGAKKLKSITVKTRNLTKKSVKNCLKSSNVKTVVVKMGTKKLNERYRAKYKPLFTKKVCGRKAIVK